MSSALALVADWNATPHDGGRWSPSWVAAQGGLRIHSAGPGRHGDIDYLMADCHVYGADRHAPPAAPNTSDHDILTWTLYDPEAPGDKWLTLMSWNLRYGRPPKLVAAQLVAVLRRLEWPDVVALQEAADYHAELRRLAVREGYRLVAFGGRGKGHNVLLVRAGHKLRRPRLWRLSPHGWHLVAGGEHRELYGVSVTVDWLRVVCLHMPPSVNWTRGVIHGPPQRVAAFASAAGRCVRLALRHRRKRS